MIFVIEQVRKFNCHAQGFHTSKINDFVNRIIHGIELSGRELQRPKINDFINRINKEIDLSGPGPAEVEKH